jgi:t-SNARE complex subunit (syntaxin)
LDIISDDIFSTKKNVELARENMEEANQYQKRSRAKYIMFTLLIVIVVGLVIAFTVVL